MSSPVPAASPKLLHLPEPTLGQMDEEWQKARRQFLLQPEVASAQEACHTSQGKYMAFVRDCSAADPGAIRSIGSAFLDEMRLVLAAFERVERRRLDPVGLNRLQGYQDRIEERIIILTALLTQGVEAANVAARGFTKKWLPAVADVSR